MSISATDMHCACPLDEENMFHLLTTLVNIVFTTLDFLRIRNMSQSGLLPHRPVTFGEYHQLMSRNPKFLDRFPNNLLTGAIGINVRRIPRIEAPVPSAFQ